MEVKLRRNGGKMKLAMSVPVTERLGLGLTVRYSAVGVGVNSAVTVCSLPWPSPSYLPSTQCRE